MTITVLPVDTVGGATTQVPVTRQVLTTAPITGGGDLSADRTVAMAAATTTADGYLKAQDWNVFTKKGLYQPITPTAVALPLTEAHYTVLVSGNTSVTLPVAAGVSGRIYVIKKVDAVGTTTTIAVQGAETIDGAAGETIAVQYSVLRVQSDGANWVVI